LAALIIIFRAVQLFVVHLFLPFRGTGSCDPVIPDDIIVVIILLLQ